MTREQLKMLAYRLIGRVELLEGTKELEECELHLLRALEYINFRAEMRLKEINREEN